MDSPLYLDQHIPENIILTKNKQNHQTTSRGHLSSPSFALDLLSDSSVRRSSDKFQAKKHFVTVSQ